MVGKVGLLTCTALRRRPEKGVSVTSEPGEPTELTFTTTAAAAAAANRYVNYPPGAISLHRIVVVLRRSSHLRPLSFVSRRSCSSISAVTDHYLQKPRLPSPRSTTTRPRATASRQTPQPQPMPNRWRLRLDPRRRTRQTRPTTLVSRTTAATTATSSWSPIPSSSRSVTRRQRRPGSSCFPLSPV